MRLWNDDDDDDIWSMIPRDDERCESQLSKQKSFNEVTLSISEPLDIWIKLQLHIWIFRKQSHQKPLTVFSCSFPLFMKPKR